MSLHHENNLITFEDISKFYGEVLGINRVNLSISPGITTLVGPNGSGKTTLMNLVTGLIRPSAGSIRVLGIRPNEPERLFRLLGYCTQFDSFPRGFTGFDLIFSYLRLHGYPAQECEKRTWQSLQRVNLVQAARRRIAGYSKGMRQRVKLAQAISHDPEVLILDEPLNGLDPMGRAEMIALFQQLAEESRHVIISSHILHEVDMISDRVVLVNNGYLVAEGDIQGVRSEVVDQPVQILIRCDRPSFLASRIFEQDHVVEVRMHDDRKGVLVRTRDADRFFQLLNQLVVSSELNVETVAPVDEDVHSVYQYLIGYEGGQ